MKAFFKQLLEPAKTKAEAQRRLMNIAVVVALIGFLCLLVFFTVPVWVDAAYIPRFKALFLTFAACFALLAGGILGAIALIRRDLY